MRFMAIVNDAIQHNINATLNAVVRHNYGDWIWVYLQSCLPLFQNTHTHAIDDSVI